MSAGKGMVTMNTGKRKRERGREFVGKVTDCVLYFTPEEFMGSRGA